MAQEQYTVNFDKSTTSTARRISKIALNTDEKTLESSNLSYRDLHETVIFEVLANQELTPKIVLASGHWIHGLCYVDLNQDGQFTFSDPNENVSNSVLTGNPGGTINFTSSFKAPSTPGDYRMRFKTEWVGENTTDAMNPGGGTEITKSGIDGSIVDVTLRVKASVSFTYNYKFNGETKHSETVVATTGESFPASTWVQPWGINKGAVPTSKVSADDAGQSFDIELTQDANYPFEYSSDYASAHWYKLGFRPDYSYYVYYTPESANNVMANNNTNAPMTSENRKNYGWAFIGNPFDGYTIVNNGAGETMSLTSANTPRNLVISDGKKWILTSPYQSETNGHKNFSLIPADGSTTDRNNLQSNLIKTWSGNDVGSAFWAEPLDLSVAGAAIEAKEAALAIISVPVSVLFGNPETEGTAAYVAKQAIESVTYDGTDESEVANAVNEYKNIVKTYYAAANGKKVVFYNDNRNNKYMVVVDAVQLAGANDADGRSVFQIDYVADSEGQFTIKNLATGRYIAKTPAIYSRVQLSTEPGKFTIKSFGIDNKFAFICVNPSNSTHNSLHLDASFNVVPWEADGNTSASVWNVQTSAITNEQLAGGVIAVKQQAYTKAANAKPSAELFGEGLGKYTKNDAYNTTEATIDAKSNDLDFEEILALENTLKNNLAACINLPKAGSFLVIQGTTGGKYMNGRALSEEEKAMWYGEDNKLIAFSTGLGFKNTSEDAAINDAFNTQTFSAAHTTGTYFIVSNASGVGQYMYENTGNVDRYTINAHDRLRWNVSYATTLPIKVNAAEGAYYGTINLPVAVTLPAGLKAYSAVATGDVLTLTKVAGEDEATAVLAANTPVILYSESNVTSVAISKKDGTGAGTNELQGTVAAASVGYGENYVLSGGANGVGFYKYNNTTMPGFKAYLPASATSNVAAFKFSFDDVETAIRAIESVNNNAEIYDLNGRRVQKAQKGLYIVNGKKVMFK